MRLEELTLRNFKGQAGLTLKPSGKDMTIYGDNAAGKTTIADAFFWQLFDKDSQNRKDFEIKTLDTQTGEAIHMLEHEVYSLFSVGDDTVSFQKILKEDWVKKRGSATQEFSGHTTNHKVNGVPASKRDYDLRIQEYCDEKRFRLLSDPTYFNTQLHWQDRRKILLEACGDISDAEVIAQNKDLAKLPEILGRHSLDDYRKIIKARRTEINNEISSIPVRIDELRRSLPAEASVPADMDILRAALNELTEKRAQVSAGGAIAQKTMELREVEAQLLDAVNQARAAVALGGADARHALSTAENALSAAQNSASSLQGTIDTDNRTLAGMDAELNTLRSQFAAVKSRVFEWTGKDSCGACGQALPEERIFQARSNALDIFNKEMSEKLEANKAAGTALRKKRDELALAITTKETNLTAVRESLAGLVAERDRLSTAAQPAPETDLSADPAYKALKEKRTHIEADIALLRSGAASQTTELDEQIAAQNKLVQDAQQVIAAQTERTRSLARIEELAAKERTLASELEKLDAETFLTEEFIRTKVSGLESRINSRFQTARFKLFEEQVNGALNEICETVIEGVPYNSLNHGARLNAGLDIINVLSDHYDFAPPVIIDNAESVTRILPTRGQQIRLVVSVADPTLRVEYDAAMPKEATLL